jgi:glutamate 5-kinase
MAPILVVKVGTSTLLSRHEAPMGTFEVIANSIISLRERYRIVLVTSGAIGFGVVQAGIGMRPTEIAKLQALSMMGQVGLLRRWREAFDPLAIGQVLVTRADLERQASSDSFRQSVGQLWEYGAIPILNENDAVSNDEISFGDNDQLAAEVAVAIGAQHLILLTDQDGIRSDFGTMSEQRIPEISVEDVGKHLTTAGSPVGKGGALSKVQAARIALEAGVEVMIAHAASPNSIHDALAGKIGTKLVQ